MTEDREAILTRIRKLLAMAKDVSSPHEAAIAAQRARKLMDKYQIDECDLRDKSQFIYKPIDREYRFFPVWKEAIAIGIAYLNDTIYTQEKNYKSINQSYSYRGLFQGYELDVNLSCLMYDYLVATVERLCKEWMAIESPGYYHARMGDSFKKGASVELQQRAKAIMEQRKNEEMMPPPPGGIIGTSLVLYKRAAVEDHFGKMRTTSGTRSMDQRASSAGHEAARGISLDPQIRGPRNDLTRLPRA